MKRIGPARYCFSRRSAGLSGSVRVLPKRNEAPTERNGFSFLSPRWSSRTLSRAECRGTCRSTGAAVPGPLASGRRSAEGPGSSGNGALPSDPGRGSEGAAPWTRRKTGHNSGDLGGSKSLYSAAPQPAWSPSGLGLALWMDTDVRIIH